LRLDVYRDFGAPKFAPFNINFVVIKTEDHSWAKVSGTGQKETYDLSRTSKEHLEGKS